jgi:hypothetical protein
MSFTSSDFERSGPNRGGVMARPERDTESIGIGTRMVRGEFPVLRF